MVLAWCFVPQYAHTGPCCASSHSRVATKAFRVVGCDVNSLRGLCGLGGPPRFRRLPVPRPLVECAEVPVLRAADAPLALLALRGPRPLPERARPDLAPWRAFAG